MFFFVFNKLEHAERARDYIVNGKYQPNLATVPEVTIRAHKYQVLCVYCASRVFERAASVWTQVAKCQLIATSSAWLEMVCNGLSNPILVVKELGGGGAVLPGSLCTQIFHILTNSAHLLQQ